MNMGASAAARRAVAASSGSVSRCARTSLLFIRLFCRDLGRAATIDREDAGHRGSLAGRAVDRYRAAVKFDEAADDGKTEADAAMFRTLGAALEALEHLVDLVRPDAAPPVGDTERDGVRAARRGQHDRRALGREADRIGQQV